MEHVYIIHLERETARDINISQIKKHIIKLNNKINFIIYPAIDKNNIDFNKYRDLKVYHRLPTHKNESIIRGEVALCKTYLAILQEIVDKRLNNVLILEDDVMLNIGKSLDFKIPPNVDLFYLGGHIWNDAIWGTYSILYPRWETTKLILDEFKEPRRFRAIDSMIKRYIHPRFNIDGYYDNRNGKTLDKMDWVSSILVPDFTRGSILRDFII